jgi:hypothetical protein
MENLAFALDFVAANFARFSLDIRDFISPQPDAPLQFYAKQLARVAGGAISSP